MGEETEREPTASGEKKDRGTPISIRPDYQGTFPTFYTNFALVSHTGDDLSLDFCIVAPPHNLLPDQKALAVPVIARVIIPPGMAKGLVDAINQQLTEQTRELAQGSLIISGPSQETHPNA